MLKNTIALLACVVGIAAQASCLRTSQNALSSSGLDDDAGIDDVHLGAVPAEHIWSHGFGSADDDNATAVIALADGSVVVGGTMDNTYGGTGCSKHDQWSAGPIFPPLGWDPRASSRGSTPDRHGPIWSRSFAGTGQLGGERGLAPRSGRQRGRAGRYRRLDRSRRRRRGRRDRRHGISPRADRGRHLRLEAASWISAAPSQLAIDGNGNIYAVGQLHQDTSTTIDGIPLVTSTYARSWWRVRSAPGTATWAHGGIVGGGGPTPFPGANSDARPPGGTQNSWLQGVAVDSEGVVVGGMVTGDADLGAGVVPAIGVADAMAVAYSSDGTFAWARRWGG